MVMARELSAILGLQMRATWSSYRIAIHWPEDLTNQTSVIVQHYVCKTTKRNARAPLAAPRFLRLQVSANQFPAAIDIRMIPEDRLTSAVRDPLEIPIAHSQRRWNRRKEFVDG